MRSAVPRPQGRLVVLGVDGLDWRMLDAEVNAGRLAAFADLFARGSVGRVDVVATGLPAVSPKIWTSFVTGYLPQRHGILDFTYKPLLRQRRLMSSLQRQSAALWEIANEYGRTAGVVNWWSTYPVEPVRGFMISDRFIDVEAKKQAQVWGASFERDTERAIHPQMLAESMEALVRARSPNRVLDPRDAELVDRSVFDLAAKAVALVDVDVLLVYTRALDSLSHLHWKTHEPLPGEEKPVRDLVQEYLQLYDGMLAEFLASVRPQDHLVLLSDHGFDRSTEELSGVHDSARAAVGVFIAMGPRVRKGVRMGTADVLDVMPTLLELAGLPVAEDMPGKVLAEAFLEGERSFLPRTQPYRRTEVRSQDGETSAADEGIRERLRALGYSVD